MNARSVRQFVLPVLLAGLGLMLAGRASAQITNYSLGTTAQLVGSTAGTNSVVLAATPQSAAWTATTNATWLHLTEANQSGTGSTNVVFSFDANSGATRSGTLTIAGQTLTITQAGSPYVAVSAVTTLVSSQTSASILNRPYDVAVDGAGNVYAADFGNNAIEKWTPGSTNVTTLVSGIYETTDVAVDGAGNVYFDDYFSGLIKEWTAGNSNVTTLVSGVSEPAGVAVDGAGNVYFSTFGSGTVQEWTAANSNVTTLASGLSEPEGVAVDGAGNVYIAGYGSGAVYQWTAANSNLTTLVSGLSLPTGVAVDGAGNVYIAAYNNEAIFKWTAANKNLTPLVSGLLDPTGVAVDGAGNVYIAAGFVNPADNIPTAIKELPYAFIDPTPKVERGDAGSDVLPVVLPATENLLAPFVPSSDQSWLTITGITNGVVSFAVSANPGLSSRTAHITLLDQTITVTDVVFGSPPILSLLPAPGNGVLQFAFGNTNYASFTVQSSTNLSLPVGNWTVAGTASNVAPGLFQFTVQTTNDQCFFIVHSP